MHTTLEAPQHSGIEKAQPKRVGAASEIAVVDLCCGMGGLSLAARNLGLSVKAGVDISASALKTYKKNFPNAEDVSGSVCDKETRNRCAEALKSGAHKDTVVVSGPPCQGFSMAGRRDPQDPRNQVLLSVARAIVELGPACALIENVPLILDERYGAHTTEFQAILREGGYFTASFILKASDYGVAQNRRRALFFVTKLELDREAVANRLEELKRPRATVSSVLKDLPIAPPRPLDYCDEAPCLGIPNHLAMRHSEAVIEKICNIPPGTGPMSYRRLHPDRPSNTLFSGHRAPPAHHEQGRSITVREAARLQGFPDNFRVYGAFGSQMEQVTNSVPPPLGEVALRVLLENVGLIGLQSS